MPAQTVNVTAVVLVAIETLFVPAPQVPTMVMPVEVTVDVERPANVPNALVSGSKVNVIDWVGSVEVGLTNEIVWFAGVFGRESLIVSLTCVKLGPAAFTVWRKLNPAFQITKLMIRPDAAAAARSFFSVEGLINGIVSAYVCILSRTNIDLCTASFLFF